MNDTATPILESIASTEQMLTNAAVSPSGRIFAGFPRWTKTVPPSVGELQADGSFKPFPGGAWNSWAPGLQPEKGFVCVHALHADRKNQLWVLDDGAPMHADIVPGGPKVVQIDLATDAVKQVFLFDERLAPEGAILSHMRVNSEFIFVADAGLGSLIVVSRSTGKGRRLFENAACSRADPSIKPMLHGKPFLNPQGDTPVLHLSHLELSCDEKWIYFSPLFGPILRRIRVLDLTNESLDDAELEARVENVARIPPVAGIHALSDGSILLCGATDNAILRLDDAGQISELLKDPRISFPNEGAIDENGNVYFPNSMAHLIGRPFEIFKFNLKETVAQQ